MFRNSAGGIFSQTASVDVALAVYDADYSEYIYSMDISGLPDWLTISGDIADSHDIDSDSYHHEFESSCACTKSGQDITGIMMNLMT